MIGSIAGLSAFRAQKSTAPLKLAEHGVSVLARAAFPCSEEHGPIEACVFPPPIRADQYFPCSEEHGPIEADECDLYGLCRRSFRAQKSTAPLKQVAVASEPSRKNAGPHRTRRAAFVMGMDNAEARIRSTRRPSGVAPSGRRSAAEGFECGRIPAACGGNGEGGIRTLGAV